MKNNIIDLVPTLVTKQYLDEVEKSKQSFLDLQKEFLTNNYSDLYGCKLLCNLITTALTLPDVWLGFLAIETEHKFRHDKLFSTAIVIEFKSLYTYITEDIPLNTETFISMVIADTPLQKDHYWMPRTIVTKQDLFDLLNKHNTKKLDYPVGDVTEFGHIPHPFIALINDLITHIAPAIEFFNCVIQDYHGGSIEIMIPITGSNTQHYLYITLDLNVLERDTNLIGKINHERNHITNSAN
jgi:hypothetical protein